MLVLGVRHYRIVVDRFRPSSVAMAAPRVLLKWRDIATESGWTPLRADHPSSEGKICEHGRQGGYQTLRTRGTLFLPLVSKVLHPFDVRRRSKARHADEESASLLVARMHSPRR